MSPAQGVDREAVVQVRNVTKSYGSRFGGPSVRALDRASLEVKRGDFAAVMGPSGSGKTTLLKLVARIDRPDSGNILVGGKDIGYLSGDALSDFRRMTIGFIFQDSALLDSMTLQENIALPLALSGVPDSEANERASEAAASLGIGSILAKYPWEVSGGQRQRAAAARALAVRPAVLLADEPTGALDSRSSRELLEEFTALNRERGTTVLLVTHDPFVASWARRTVFLKDGAVFTEIHAGGDRRAFFDRILEVQAAMENLT